MEAPLRWQEVAPAADECSDCDASRRGWESCSQNISFSDLDYITTFMVPTTFEALIHEVIGIENGIIQLPNVQANDTVPSSLNLHSSVTPSFQVRHLYSFNAPVSRHASFQYLHFHLGNQGCSHIYCAYMATNQAFWPRRF